MKKINFILITLLFSQSSFAYELKAKLVIPESNEKITNLQWVSEEPLVKTIEVENKTKISVILKGNYANEDWNLIRDAEPTTLSEKGEFTMEIPVTKKITPIELTAIGPLGEVERQIVQVQVMTIGIEKEEINSDFPSQVAIVPALQFSSIAYTETGVSDYSEIAVTGKIQYLRSVFSKRWDVGASVFFTLFPLSRTPSITARFLGVNARFGYILPWLQEPWKLSLLGGVYYVTSFVTSSQFGFKNMMGPQIFPTLRRILNNGSSISTYLKYSPVSGKLKIRSLSDREIAFGVSYTYLQKNNHPIIALFDISNIKLLIQGISINSTTISLGVGYGI